MKFQPDYKNIVDVISNKEAKRVPLYEHNISVTIMEKIMGEKFAELYKTDKLAFFKKYSEFFLQMGYDTVTYEACITEILPFGGALAHPKKGYIDSMEKFKEYPFDEVLSLYIARFDEDFKALKATMPNGMKAIGGVGNGVFEIAQDLVGYQDLCILSFEDKELYQAVFEKIGDMMYEIWTWFLRTHADTYCVVRFGDDLGYKSNTMLSHDDIKELIVPQYARIISLCHSFDKPFLLHSCGCIFDVMDDLIEKAKINGKHSNEDQIAEFGEWVKRYGDRIANFGGVDTDHIVRLPEDKLEKLVTNLLDSFARGHGGFAIGSGNSIPDYVDVNRYLVMINTTRKWRGDFR